MLTKKEKEELWLLNFLEMNWHTWEEIKKFPVLRWKCIWIDKLLRDVRDHKSFLFR